MSSNPYPLPGSVTIAASIRSYLFWDNSRATQNLDWESPWEWVIRRFNAVDGPNDPKFTVSSSIPNSAQFYSGKRAITAQYVVQQNGPFEQKSPCLVETQESMTVTNAYLTARFDKYYNKVIVVTPDHEGYDTDVYIGPAGLTTWNSVRNNGTILGREWNTGEFSFPAIFQPTNQWSLYLLDPVQGLQEIFLNGIYNTIGSWEIMVNYPTRRSLTLSDDTLVQAGAPDAMKVIGVANSVDFMKLIR